MTRLWHLLQCALHLVARVTALARDFCESMYASYPAEEVEEAEEEFVIVLGWDGER